jgi:hypothetical protein
MTTTTHPTTPAAAAITFTSITTTSFTASLSNIITTTTTAIIYAFFDDRLFNQDKLSMTFLNSHKRPFSKEIYNDDDKITSNTHTKKIQNNIVRKMIASEQIDFSNS